ncbi:hypothetical protein CAPTEDRAFT_226069, partial [Capitella teleta]
MSALLILFVAAVAVASASDLNKVVHTKHVSYQNPQPHNGYAPQAHAPSYSNAAVYHGQYNGKCGNDGFYYNDHSSFVMCSNGNAYIQPCAPGSKNSANDKYNFGSSYNYRDFCDVNLVDDGYALKHGAGYHGNGAATYGHGAGYGSNIGYAGFNAGYGYDSEVKARGYNSNDYNGHNEGFRGQHDAGYGDQTYGGSYKKTEYKTYGTGNSVH